jgi:hypothetical protein
MLVAEPDVIFDQERHQPSRRESVWGSDMVCTSYVLDVIRTWAA